MRDVLEGAETQTDNQQQNTQLPEYLTQLPEYFTQEH